MCVDIDILPNRVVARGWDPLYYISVVGRMSDTEGGAVSGGGDGARGGGVDRPATVPMAKPVVLPETFDGTRGWDEWCFHFENVASVNDSERLKWLQVRLTGRAQKALHRLTEAQR